MTVGLLDEHFCSDAHNILRLVHFKVLVSNLNEFLGNICCRLHSTIRKDGASQGRGEQNAKNEWKLSSEFRYFFKIELEPRQQISRLDLK